LPVLRQVHGHGWRTPTPSTTWAPAS
jgi:hypothetical protein